MKKQNPSIFYLAFATVLLLVSCEKENLTTNANQEHLQPVEKKLLTEKVFEGTAIRPVSQETPDQKQRNPKPYKLQPEIMDEANGLQDLD